MAHKVVTEMQNSQIEDLISKLEESEAEVERLKAANAKWENELLKELFVWADNWLSDEAKDQGARAVLQKVRAALAGQIKSHEAHTWQQERAAVVAWLRLEPSYRNRPLAVITADVERGEHWPEGRTPNGGP